MSNRAEPAEWTDLDPSDLPKRWDDDPRSFGDREQVPRALSEAEARAASILLDDGWTYGELSMTFQAGEMAVRRAIEEISDHE